ncbi:MAG TPA: NAD-dependent epimerase/dehydratase family protein, partial [Myxococcota bacterium]|nr:NAD-dependent epimerase/dehydratase family protein [Myxococcota bacterium]
MRICVTGISGRLGRRVAQMLRRKHEVVGIDQRASPGLPANIVHHQVDIRRRPAEDILRNGKFDAVVHLGTIH